MSPENEAKLDEALRRLDMFKPIIVREIDEGLEILGGAHRRDSAIRIGLEEVPIFNLGPIDDAKAKEISLADNARYGFDDTHLLAEVMKDLETDALHQFLPYTDDDLNSIFSAKDIALSELDLDPVPEEESLPDEPKALKAPKTHTIMQFKVPLSDAERITEIIAKTQKRHGYTASDEKENAGDALVHLLFAREEMDS